MTDLIRRFRGLGVALVVLALSAGVVFAAAPRYSPVGNTETTLETTTTETTTVATTTVVTTTTTTTTEGDEDGDGNDADSADGAPTDTHGALVSTAAQATTPPGFANHGAFVACVAHMDKGIDAATFDWTTVTPLACGLTPTPAPDATTQSGTTKGEAKSQAGKAKGEARSQAGKAKGKAKSGR